MTDLVLLGLTLGVFAALTVLTGFLAARGDDDATSGGGR